jgi:hypothetical protein
MSRSRLWIIAAVLAVVGIVAVAVAWITTHPGDDAMSRLLGVGGSGATGGIGSGSASGTLTPGATGGSAAGGASGASSMPANPPDPVTEPTKLTDVRTPPPHTIAMVDGDGATAGSTYAILFVPYGLGPGGASGKLVIAIKQSTPAAGVEKAFKFEGRNALVDVSRLPADQTVKIGGTYSGELQLVKSGDLLIPTLLSVTPKK